MIIDVVTTSRADFGIYIPILRRFQQEPDVAFRLLVSGMHLAPQFGRTDRWIEAEGFRIDERIPILLADDNAQSTSMAMGLALIGFSTAYARSEADFILLLGDRFEMAAAALAAVPFRIPIVHLHGGELSLGAIDDALRHMITKLSHIHFVSNERYAQRVVQLGEEPWRVVVSGAPSLDHLRSMSFPSRAELESILNFSLDPAPIVVTYHPATLSQLPVESQIQELLAALSEFDLPIIFTAANADPGGRLLSERIEQFCCLHPKALLVKSLGTHKYFGLLKHAAVMVGNSSSGIVEAPSFSLPVVNIGPRQDGRIRGPNVIDTPEDRNLIRGAIRKALSADFRRSLLGIKNPYDTGLPASEIILSSLKKFHADRRLLQKQFRDL